MRSGPNRGWGGARANAGRPASGPIPSEPHKQRAPLSPRHPVHVIARSLPRLGGRQSYRAIWRAVQRSLDRSDFRVIALVVRSRRVELVVEAESSDALARGMQGLQVSAARQLNRVLRRSGCVFADRYRPAVLRTRAQVRAVLAGIERGRRSLRSGGARRLSWPETYVLLVELVPRVHQRVANPDP